MIVGCHDKGDQPMIYSHRSYQPYLMTPSLCNTQNKPPTIGDIVRDCIPTLLSLFGLG